MSAKTIDKLAYIQIVNQAILITRSQGKDTFYIPGGKREANESDHDALIREIREELTVELKPETIEYLATFEAQAHGQPEGVMVKMTCYTADYEGEFHPSSEIEEIDWFHYHDKHRTSPVDQLIFDWLKENNQIS